MLDFQTANGQRKIQILDKGSFVDGKKEGQGTYTFKSGDYYNGEWRNEKRNGNGKFYNKATNTTQEGSWKDDVFVGSTK